MIRWPGRQPPAQGARTTTNKAFGPSFHMASPSAQFSLTLRVELERGTDIVGRVTSAIGDAGGSIGAIDIVEQGGASSLRDFTVDTTDGAHGEAIVTAIGAVHGARVVEITDRTLELHRGGKLYTGLRAHIHNRDDLSMAYTPGVARVCMEIAADRDKAHEYTIKKNTVAVVTDGTAVLGLGDIGPEAAMPVMEGKAILFKEFAGVDAFPIALDTKDPDEIVQAVKLIAPTFGGINLEDISSPRCFDIENRLIEELDIPVFHDDQHGTAIVVLAALLNACRLTGRRIEDLHVAMVGAGAAGVAVAKILMSSGVTSIVACDRYGAIHTGRTDFQDGSMNAPKTWLAEHTNGDRRRRVDPRGAGRPRPVHRPRRPGARPGRGPQAHERRRLRVRDGQPEPRGAARGGRAVRARDGHRPLRLPQPDQQRAGLPGRLPRRARRARAATSPRR